MVGIVKTLILSRIGMILKKREKEKKAPKSRFI
jgi:hypothetical protein